MRKLALILSFFLLAQFSMAQSAQDSLITVKGVSLYQNGEKLSNPQIRGLLLSSYTDGEHRYDEYIQQQWLYGIGWVNIGCGLVLAGTGVALHIMVVNAVERNGGGCVSPGGIAIAGGGVALALVGAILSAESHRHVVSFANDLNGSRYSPELSVGATPNGVGVLLSF